jgi:hypothetical protein
MANVSVSLVQGKPSNQAVIPVGRPNTSVRRKAPGTNLIKETGELNLFGCI